MSLRELPRIARLDLSVVELPDWHPEAPNQATVPVFGYVIDHPDGAILFDTGVGFGNDFIAEVYTPRSARLDRALAEHAITLDSLVAVREAPGSRVARILLVDDGSNDDTANVTSSSRLSSPRRLTLMRS